MVFPAQGRWPGLARPPVVVTPSSQCCRSPSSRGKHWHRDGLLEPSKTESVCPYKGITSAYWTFRNGDAVYPDIAWTYDYPLREVAPIAAMIAFYNEKLDIIVDDTLLPRPQTIFT